MEQLCVLCFKNKSTDSLFPPDLIKKKEIFNLICYQCKIPEATARKWNFETEDLPFCKCCLSNIHGLQDSYMSITNAEANAVHNIEVIRSTLQKSTSTEIHCSIGSTDETATTSIDISVGQTSVRVDEFRKQAFKCLGSGHSAFIPDDIFSETAATTDSASDASQVGNEVRDQELGEQDELFLPSGGVESSSANANENVSTDTDTNNCIEEPSPKWHKNSDGSYQYGCVDVIKPPEGSTAWECGLCDFVVPPTNKSHPRKAIEYHIRAKHLNLETKYKCAAPGCQKRFRSSHKLEEHIEKDHEASSSVSSSQYLNCSYCDKSYKNSTCLKTHEKSHTVTQLPHEDSSSDDSMMDFLLPPPPNTKMIFRCQFCDKYFSRKSNRRRHEELHTKSIDERKEHLCSDCGNLYTLEGLTEHSRLVHKKGGSKINYVKCTRDNCSKQFPQKCKLQRHIKKVHDKVTTVK